MTAPYLALIPPGDPRHGTVNGRRNAQRQAVA